MKTKYCFFILMAAFILPAGLAAGNIEFVGPLNYTTGTDPVYVMASDFDNDGDNDLSVMNFHSENMSLLFNTGTGTFAPQVKYNIGTLPRSLYNSDLDGDNDIDIIVVDLSLDSVFVMKNDGSGLFTVAGSYTAGDGPAAIAAADYDGDGDNDLAIANWSSANISILMNDGNGTFGDPINYDSEKGPGCIVSSDFDSDGDPDLAVTNWYANSVTVYENDGAGNFAPAISYIVNLPRQIGLADFDGDGYGDMAVADDSSDVITIFLCNNNFAFTNSGSYDAGAGPRSVNAADLDGDGDPDLAVANYDIDSISILINDGNAAFSRALSYGAGEGPYYITISDLDNDNDYDLAVTNHDGNNLSVFLNECFGEVIHVPGDQPTIQAGIDYAVPGDTVLVADGTYTGDGNRDIDFGGKGVVLKSENGPDFTIIDCQGDVYDRHRGFCFHSGEDSTAVVDGFTIQGGSPPDDGPDGSSVGGGIKCDSSSSPLLINNTISENFTGGYGAGIFCNNNSNPTINNNTISGNSAGYGGGIFCRENSNPTISNNAISGNLAWSWTGGRGGGIFCDNSSPTISNNTISGNSAGSHGGGIYCYGNSSPAISNNTISGNSAWDGGGISCSNSSPTISNSIIAFNSDNTGVIYCSENSSPVLACCDVYGNTSGDWVGCIADQMGINGNFSADPLFCDTANGNYHIYNNSPCDPTNNDCEELIGALGIGCDFEFTQIYFDIKPGSCPNPINIKVKENGKAVIPAAILGTKDFDVHDIDVNSIKLVGVSPVRYNYDDVSAPTETDDSCDCSDDGPDGYEDLTLKFNKRSVVSAILQNPDENYPKLAITGLLNDGTSFEGTDCFVLRPKDHIKVDSLKEEVAIINVNGDVNGDGLINLIDVSAIIHHLYKNPDDISIDTSKADADNSGEINILDITFIINNIFK